MSPYPIDLHIHTWYSDGKCPPEEMLRRAAQGGVTTIAITDHDNTRGSRAAKQPAKELGIELVPAIEFTATWKQCQTPPGEEDIDVLGYFVDIDRPEFQAFEQKKMQDVYNRMGDFCAILTAGGYPIRLEDLAYENPRYPGNIQLAHALYHKGYAGEIEGVRVLMDRFRKQTRPGKATIQQIIRAIRSAGGVAILAHPSLVKCSGKWLGKSRFASLVEMGLDGIEIYHPRMNLEAQEYFLALARQFNLLVSGGSDDHGWSTDSNKIGSQPVTADMLEALRGRHMERNQPKQAITASAPE